MYYKQIVLQGKRGRADAPFILPISVITVFCRGCTISE